ncbi:M23 family metallopeptidase [Patescibacteria group bacterium]|nr:M23 family metallopeptidase [Patescibacteria group bacterium]
MNRKIIFIGIFTLVIIILTSVYLLFNKQSDIQNPLNNDASIKNNVDDSHATNQLNGLNIISAPINNALIRITKKPFGIKISPEQSPIAPERFAGYHTGVDFETYPDEQNQKVKIYAICDGPLVFKQFVSGYGGAAVQQCKIDNNDVTVIYGHLNLSSIADNLNQSIKAESPLGILGQGFSDETDNERKHLHLGIHKGNDIDIRGYVQTQSELEDWIDFATQFK